MTLFLFAINMMYVSFTMGLPAPEENTELWPDWASKGIDNKYSRRERMFNLCPAFNYNPLFADGSEVRICLAENGLGYQNGDGDCIFYNATSQQRASIPNKDVICRFEDHPNLVWLDKDSSDIDEETMSFQIVYIRDSESQTANYVVCRAQVDGMMKAGWSRRNKEERPSSPCYIDNDPVESGVEYLIFKTDVGDNTLWDQRNEVDVDHSGGILAEGAYSVTPTINECEYWCENLPQCAAYVWYRRSGQCWLKVKGIVDSYPSGEKGRDPSNPSRGRIMPAKESYLPKMDGVEFMGANEWGTLIQEGAIIIGDRIQQYDMTAEECIDSCRSMEKCVAITYITYGLECFRFDKTGPIKDGYGDGVTARVIK